MLAALGVGTAQALAGGGARLADLADDGLQGLVAARERFRGVELVVAADVDLTLLGFHGASASAAADMGATPEGAQQLEGALGRLTEVAQRTLPPARDLLTGAARRLDREPGAGAAGGLGYGLLLLGGHVRSGVDAVLQAVGFDDRLGAADLLVTGEAVLDWQSLRGTVVAGVAQAALAVAVPTVVLAGQAHVGRRETMALGISGSYAVAERSDRVPPVRGRPGGHAWRRARPGWPPPGPRAATARRTLTEPGTHPRRPWVGTVDRTPLRRAWVRSADHVPRLEGPHDELNVDTQAAAEATDAPAHGVVLTDVAATRSRACSSRRVATTSACASACSPAAAPA